MDLVYDSGVVRPRMMPVIGEIPLDGQFAGVGVGAFDLEAGQSSGRVGSTVGDGDLADVHLVVVDRVRSSLDNQAQASVFLPAYWDKSTLAVFQPLLAVPSATSTGTTALVSSTKMRPSCSLESSPLSLL